MILTTDALVGGTLALTLMATTTPVLMNTAKKASEIRRDLVAEQIAVRCNAALMGAEDVLDSDLRTNRGVKSYAGDCGASQGDMEIEFANGDTRLVSFDGELYVMS